jgi:hypothetical protein
VKLILELLLLPGSEEHESEMYSLTESLIQKFAGPNCSAKEHDMILQVKRKPAAVVGLSSCRRSFFHRTSVHLARR